MSDPFAILRDPNYVNANAATKKAIFDRRIATMPEYRNANPATQQAIQLKFNISQPTSNRENVQAEGPGMLESIGRGAWDTMQHMGQYVPDVGGMLTRAMVSDKTQQNMQKAQQTYLKPPAAQAYDVQRGQQAKQQHPFAYGAGGMLPTLPVGGAVANTAKVLAAGTRAAPIINALATGFESGGFKTGLVPTRAAIQAAKDEGINIAPTLVQRVVDMATRGTTGAASAATQAAMANQDAGDAAIFGGILPTVGSMGARVAMDSVILPAYELLSGRVGAKRAAEIFRASFKMPINKVREIARSAPEGVPFTQVLAKTNTLEGKNAEATAQALGRSIEQGPGRGHFAAVSGEQNAARQTQLNAMAQGQTPTEVKNAILAGKTKLGEEYATNIAPVMEGANLGGKIIPSAEADIARLQAEAAAKTNAAKRLLGGAENQSAKLGQMDDLGDAFNPEAINRQRGVVGGLENQGEKAAGASLNAGDEARYIQSQIDNLRSQGHDVLTTGPIVAQLRNMAGAPGVLGSIEKSTPLLKMAAHIESLGPIIRAEDLDAVRQSAGQFVSHLTNDPSGIARHASSLMAATKPVIDTAIENAGGVGYGAAKNAFAEGSKELGQQAFVGDLARAHAASPEDYAAIVGGYKPEVVKQAFPTGGKQNFDIGAMLPPERLAPLQDIAGEINLGTEAAKQADIGKTDAQALLAQGVHPGEKLKGMFVKLLSAKAGKLDSFVNLLAQSGISKGTQSALVDAFKSGKGADELLSLMPLADQYQLLRRGISGGTNRAISALGVNAMNAANTPPPPQNTMAGY